MTFKSPVYNVISVPIEKIEPNTYNPNSVAPPELKLLYDSIKGRWIYNANSVLLYKRKRSLCDCRWLSSISNNA